MIERWIRLASYVHHPTFRTSDWSRLRPIHGGRSRVVDWSRWRRVPVQRLDCGDSRAHYSSTVSARVLGRVLGPSQIDSENIWYLRIPRSVSGVKCRDNTTTTDHEPRTTNRQRRRRKKVVQSNNPGYRGQQPGSNDSCTLRHPRGESRPKNTQRFVPRK